MTHRDGIRRRGAGGAGHVVHLARRFVGSLRPGGPGADDERWARSWLLDGEQALWARLSGADRRHAVGVARSAVALLGARATRPVVAAALLHDAGKVESDLGTFARVGATLVGAVRGRQRPGGRIGLYLRHDAVGGELLERAGSDPLTVRWATEHHRPSSAWTVPADVGAALAAADDD